MTIKQFEIHKNQCPNVVFTLTKSLLIPIEYTYFDDYGIYNIYRRDFYDKSNGKTCYVDNIIKQVNVERHKLKPCNNGFSFVIKNKYIKEFIN